MKKKVGSGKSYADVLTILLVIIILAIIALLSFLAYKMVDKNRVETEASDADSQFLAIAEQNRKEKEKKEENQVTNNATELDLDSASALLHNSDLANLTAEQVEPTETRASNQNVKKSYMGEYEIKGSIKIAKTNCQYPILERVTVDSLKKSVAILDIVSNPELNRTVKDLNVPGTNAFILGHNYRNGQFFSNNDRLAVGDTIKITDQMGTTVTYTIYNMYYTTPDDVSFMERDIDLDTREITLQTCNDDSSERLIIFAKDK